MLGMVARTKGLLKAGGVANMDEAARSVLRDFLNGKIDYFTAPPPSAVLDEEDDLAALEQELEDAEMI